MLILKNIVNTENRVRYEEFCSGGGRTVAETPETRRIAVAETALVLFSGIVTGARGQMPESDAQQLHLGETQTHNVRDFVQLDAR